MPYDPNKRLLSTGSSFRFPVASDVSPGHFNRIDASWVIEQGHAGPVSKWAGSKARKLVASLSPGSKLGRRVEE